MSLESNDLLPESSVSNHDDAQPRPAPFTPLSGAQAMPIFTPDGSDRAAYVSIFLKEAAKAYIGVDTTDSGRVVGTAEEPFSCWFGVLRDR